jgi:hypothetical protein
MKKLIAALLLLPSLALAKGTGLPLGQLKQKVATEFNTKPDLVRIKKGTFQVLTFGGPIVVGRPRPKVPFLGGKIDRETGATSDIQHFAVPLIAKPVVQAHELGLTPPGSSGDLGSEGDLGSRGDLRAPK